MNTERFPAGISSIHFFGEDDPLSFVLQSHLNFEHAIVIRHEQGHKPPKTLPRADLLLVRDFIARLFLAKYPDESSSVEVRQLDQAIERSLKQPAKL